MKFRWAPLVCVLALCAAGPRVVAAQQQASRDPSTGSSLGQNFPNPLVDETTIPFSIGDSPDCVDGGRQYRVTLKIYNMLAQLVAIPVLQSGSAGSAGGQPLNSVLLTCGDYTAYWDGKHTANGRDVASGVYLYQLVVDGHPLVRKAIKMR